MEVSALRSRNNLIEISFHRVLCHTGNAARRRTWGNIGNVRGGGGETLEVRYRGQFRASREVTKCDRKGRGSYLLVQQVERNEKKRRGMEEDGRVLRF